MLVRKKLTRGTFALLAVACSIDPPDLASKRCPCASGYVCDAARDRCVPGQAGADAAAGLFEMADFRAAWTTPNQIRWTWSPKGVADDFLRYELVVGRSVADVEAKRNTTVFTSEDNPELGRYLLPRTGGEEPVRATSTDEHLPDTEYFAQLFIYDTQLGVTASAIAAARTGLPSVDTLVLYDDQDLSGWLLPACITQSNAKPFGSSQSSYRYTVSCGPDGAAYCGESQGNECWLQFKLGGLKLDLSGITAGQFPDAYLEYSVAIEGEAHVYWGGINLSTWDGRAFGIEPFSYRAGGEYRTYQVKLSALIDMGAPMSAAELSQPATMFMVSGGLSPGTAVYLDAVSVKW